MGQNWFRECDLVAAGVNVPKLQAEIAVELWRPRLAEIRKNPRISRDMILQDMGEVA